MSGKFQDPGPDRVNSYYHMNLNNEPVISPGQAEPAGEHAGEGGQPGNQHRQEDRGADRSGRSRVHGDLGHGRSHRGGTTCQG